MSDAVTPPPSPPPGSPSVEELRKALKAFKKRLKLARLDDESRLGHKGGKSAIVAITPPFEFPRAVWDTLAEQGKLRRAGHGTYELVEE